MEKNCETVFKAIVTYIVSSYTFLPNGRLFPAALHILLQSKQLARVVADVFFEYGSGEHHPSKPSTYKMAR